MKRITVRNDLMSKSNYSKKFMISRPTIDTRIKNGELAIERIDGVDYIKLR
jgi:hypothetical protein